MHSPTGPLLADGCGGDGWKPPNTSREEAAVFARFSTQQPFQVDGPVSRRNQRSEEPGIPTATWMAGWEATLGSSSALLCHLETPFPALGRPRAVPRSIPLRVCRPLSPGGQGPKAAGIQWHFPPSFASGLFKEHRKVTCPQCSCLVLYGFFSLFLFSFFMVSFSSKSSECQGSFCLSNS